MHSCIHPYSHSFLHTYTKCTYIAMNILHAHDNLFTACCNLLSTAKAQDSSHLNAYAHYRLHAYTPGRRQNCSMPRCTTAAHRIKPHQIVIHRITLYYCSIPFLRLGCIVSTSQRATGNCDKGLIRVCTILHASAISRLQYYISSHSQLI